MQALSSHLCNVLKEGVPKEAFEIKHEQNQLPLNLEQVGLFFSDSFLPSFHLWGPIKDFLDSLLTVEEEWTGLEFIQ